MYLLHILDYTNYLYHYVNKLINMSISFDNSISVIGNYSIVGDKEGSGNFKDYFVDSIQFPHLA